MSDQVRIASEFSAWSDVVGRPTRRRGADDIDL